MSCLVYALGKRGYWRSISAAPGKPNIPCDKAAFLNGNLYWLAFDSDKNGFVCCLDLETEIITKYSILSRLGYITSMINIGYHLCILEGRLCLRDILSPYGVVIWRMDNYGDENSWVKEYTFDNLGGLFYPLVLLNDDLIIASNNRDVRELFIYSKNTETHVTHCSFRRFAYPCLYSSIVIYTPSFLSLETMGIHNVQVLRNKFDVALEKVPEKIGDLKGKNWLAAGVSTIATVFVAAGWLAVGFSTIATCTNIDSRTLSILD